MSRKPRARSRKQFTDEPQAIPTLDFTDIAMRSRKLLLPFTSEFAKLLPPDALDDLIRSVAIATRDFLNRKETLTLEEREHELSSLRAAQERDTYLKSEALVSQVFREIDEILKTNDIRSPHWPSEYREKLAHEVASGYSVELEAFQTAAFCGTLPLFIQSRRLPGYKEAKRRVSLYRSAAAHKTAQAVKKALSDQASGKPFAAIEAALLKEKADVEKLTSSDPSADFAKGFFGTTLPAALLHYWLPLALWTFETADAMTLLQRIDPSSGFLREAPEATVSKSVLTYASNSRFWKITKPAFNKAVHDLNLRDDNQKRARRHFRLTHLSNGNLGWEPISKLQNEGSA